MDTAAECELSTANPRGVGGTRALCCRAQRSVRIAAKSMRDDGARNVRALCGIMRDNIGANQKAFVMEANKRLATAILAIAVGVPSAAFAEDMTVPQPMTSAGARVSFLHGFPSAPKIPMQS